LISVMTEKMVSRSSYTSDGEADHNLELGDLIHVVSFVSAVCAAAVTFRMLGSAGAGRLHHRIRFNQELSIWYFSAAAGWSYP